MKVLYEVEDANHNTALLEVNMNNYTPNITYSEDKIRPNDSDAEKQFKTEKNKVLYELKVAEKEALNKKMASPLADPTILTPDYIDAHKAQLEEGYLAAAELLAKTNWNEIYVYDRDNNNSAMKNMDIFSMENGYYKKIYSWKPEAAKYSNPVKDYKFKRVVKVFKKGESEWPKGDKILDYNVVEELKGGNFKSDKSEYGETTLPAIAKEYLKELLSAVKDSEQGNTLPRAALEKVVGKPIKVTGLKLERDVIPAIDKALFAQYKTQINPRLGIQAWFLRSLNNNEHTMQAGHAKTKMETHTGITGYTTGWYAEPIYGDVTSEVPDFTNDTYTSKRLANIFAIGAQYQVGDNALISLDYGFNRSDFGRYMNGHTNFDHIRGTADFTVKGHSMGGTPHFWTARLDLGQSDFTRPGSWNAFMDYKYFAHGSFFGGNGTGAVPDRYLDGIRSFTLGGGYVPRKDFLVEAFYTFDAKGIGQRDTLYGGENFKLGNYTRIQGTYKF